MRYNISFEVPDEIEALIQDFRRKYVAEKITECIHSLIANEAGNEMERHIRGVELEITKGEEDGREV